MKIPLFPGLILAVVSLVLNVVICIIVFILKIPKNLWNSLRVTLSVMLTAFPQSVREFLKLYDSNGLRHHIGFLNDNKTRKRIAVAGVAEQCKYVDIVTRQSLPKNPKFKSNYVPLFTMPATEHDDFSMPTPVIAGTINTDIDMTQINTTSIGNLAWGSLYHPDEVQRTFCTEKLKEIHDYFITMQ